MMKIIILIGESSVGKDTIALKLIKIEGFDFCISHTTRPMRNTEVNGREYFFIKDNVFDEMIDNNDFVENRVYNTIYKNKPCIWRYGLSKKELFKNNKNKVIIVDYDGYKTIKEKLKNEDVKIVSFFITAPAKNRIIRAMNRADDDSSCYEIARRLLDDRDKVSPAKMDVNYVLTNTTPQDLDLNVEIISKIVKNNL